MGESSRNVERDRSRGKDVPSFPLPRLGTPFPPVPQLHINLIFFLWPPIMTEHGRYLCLSLAGNYVFGGRIRRLSADVRFAILESLKETAYLSFLQPPSLSRLSFRQRIHRQSYCNNPVILLHVLLQFLVREGRSAFR